MKYVILLSGGLDSSIVLGLIRSKVKAEDVYALSINYNQRHIKELISAKNIAKFYNINYKVMNLDLSEFGGSALTSSNIEVPIDRSLNDISKNIPITYVPGRNTIFISLGLAYAETVNADFVALGVNSIDYSGYPDCRPEYINEFDKLSILSNKRGVEGNPIKLYTPVINMTKSDIVKLGVKLKVPYELTWTCYNGREKACGTCDSCKFRLEGFKENGLKDPIQYE